MNNVRENHEVFEVLGYSLKLKKDEELKGVEPSDIVRLVLSSASEIISKTPELSHAQVATLLALKFAGEKLALEKEFCESVKNLQDSALIALQSLEEVSSTSL